MNLYRVRFVDLDNAEYETVFVTGEDVNEVLTKTEDIYDGFEVANLELIAIDGENEDFPTLITDVEEEEEEEEEEEVEEEEVEEEEKEEEVEPK